MYSELIFTYSSLQSFEAKVLNRNDNQAVVRATMQWSSAVGALYDTRDFQVVREDRGLAYSIYSTPSFFGDVGDLVISAGLDTDNLTKTLRLILRELRRIREAAPRAAELRRAQDYVIGQTDLSLESTDNQMNWLGEQLLGYGRVFRPAEVKRRVREVTAGEIRAVARDFLRPERMSLALVSPLKAADPLARLLR